jgi:hypothetical protein
MQRKFRDLRFKSTDWLRTCQECGHVQAMKSPEGQKTDNWRDSICRKCKSEGSLDYGTPNEYWEDEDYENQAY